jgi:sugar porter (SP) family MFS transporter
MNVETERREVVQAPWWYLYMVSILAAIGGFLFGYDLSIITGAMLFLQEYFNLPGSGTGGLTASAIFGCIFGALVAVYVADTIGRRRSLMLAGVLFLISSIWSGLASGLFEFYVARAIGGIGVGIATGVSPMFIAEISPPKLRGRMVTVNQLSIVVGIVISIIVALFLSKGGHWRWMFFSETVPNVLLIFGLLLVPESPRWLASKGRFEGARQILARINGNARANEELEEIREELSEESGSFRELVQPGVRYALVAACILMIFQQINGVNMILLYGAKILVEAGIGSPTDALRNALYPNFLILFCTIIAFYVVAKFPRRHILMVGVTGMALGHLLMAFAFYTQFHRPLFSVLAMLVAAGSFTLTLAPVGWVVVSEFFPNRVRGKCMGVVTFCLFSSSFVCALAFPRITAYFEETYGTQSGAYIIFAGICLACVAFVWKFIPETKDLTLEEIGRFWLNRGKPATAGSAAALPVSQHNPK